MRKFKKIIGINVLLCGFIASIGIILQFSNPITVSQQTIWNNLEKVAVEKRYIGKPFIFVQKSNFNTFLPYFIKEWNFMHPEPSFRTREAFFHIHAIDFGNIVMLHQDTGNPALFKPLALVHFFFDFPSYYSYCWIHGLPSNKAIKPNYHYISQL